MTAAQWLPTRADLDAATARTAAAIADPSASLADVERAAELEESVLAAYSKRPGAAAELNAGLYVTEVAYAPPAPELQVLRSRPLEHEPAPEDDAGERCPRCGAVSWGQAPDGRAECTRCLWSEPAPEAGS